jgi:hypothetical protein
MIWGSMILWEVSLHAHFNEQPYDDLESMILWEVSFKYAHFNEQAYIKNRKIYEYNPYKVHWVSNWKGPWKGTPSSEWLEAR